MLHFLKPWVAPRLIRNPSVYLHLIPETQSGWMLHPSGQPAARPAASEPAVRWHLLLIVLPAVTNSPTFIKYNAKHPTLLRSAFLLRLDTHMYFHYRYGGVSILGAIIVMCKKMIWYQRKSLVFCSRPPCVWSGRVPGLQKCSRKGPYKYYTITF